jgi:hypothetical protein
MPETIDAAAPPLHLSKSRTVSKVVWTIAALLIAALAIFGETDLSVAGSAPQQAAAAAMACFRLVAVYTFARAVDALTR